MLKPVMNRDDFWKLIRRSRRGAADCNEQAENLTGLLEKLAPEEIVGFHQSFSDLLAESYRNDLWAVAYIINGGCSDDGFEYFRCWLIAQGQEFYEQVLAEPEKVAKRVKAGHEEVECEPIMQAAYDAYQNVTGQEIPAVTIAHPKEPIGEKWTEDDLERLYPKLCKRFW